MSRIEEIDKNFKIDTTINKQDIKFHNALSEQFSLHGLLYEGGKFRRIPEAVARSVSEGVYYLHANTAGGRLRFKTNSPYIAIHAKLAAINRMTHFTLCGSGGFDLYVDNMHANCFRPPLDMVDGYESVIDIGSGMHEVCIHFPLYTNVKELYIGLSEDAEIHAPTPYRNEKPVVYYGSSITQGGCASRPGTTYQDFVSRELGLDFINLGFSGNARAEDEMADYIKGLDMSAFVYDYDHNAPDAEHLEKTHERMFLAIRAKHPYLPIIMMSMPNYRLTPANEKRMQIIKRTYDNALARGDKNVYFIPGPALMEYAGNEGTVDGTHPTDLGFYSMAQALTGVMRDII